MPTDIKTLKNLPLFVSNQVLTAELLNNMSQYLNKQTRLATLHGIGRGIVCGLEMTVQADNTITISAGHGFTSDGYLIQYEGGTFTHYEVYQDPIYAMLNTDKKRDFDPKMYQYDNWEDKSTVSTATPPPPPKQLALWELKKNGEVDKALTASALSDKCVVLYLEFSFQDLHSCVTSNCNNKGWEILWNVKPLLVSKSYLTTSVVLPSRPRNLFKAIPRLHKHITLSAVHSATALMQGYETLAKSMAPKLDVWIAITYHELKFKFDLGDLTLPQITPKIMSIPAVTGTWQTAYDFLKDVVDAYNELLQIACPFLNSVCLAEKSFGRHLTLGATSNAPNYRHLFESATLLTPNQAVIEQIQRYFKRLTVLMEHFEPNPAIVTPIIRISPSHTAVAALGDRAVPFYYSKTEVENHWRVNSPCIYPDLTGYHFQDFATTTEIDHDSDYNYDKNNFFRIEGHLGQPLRFVESEFASLKTIHHLEFDVFSVKLLNTVATRARFFEDENWTRVVLLEINERLAKEHFRQYDILQLNYEAVPQRNFTDYSEAFSKIRSFLSRKLLSTFQGWQKERCNLNIFCSISFLQSDYLILRGELLTHFKRFKSHFAPLMTAYVASFKQNVNAEVHLNLTKREVGTLTQMHLFDLYLDLLADQLLPGNLVAFNYPLFIEIFKEWHRVVYELRALVSGVWANDLLEDLMREIKKEGQLQNNNFSFDPLPSDFKGRLSRYLNHQTNDFHSQTLNVSEAFKVLATHTDPIIASLSDIFAFINTYFEHKTQQQLAAVYYGLEHVMNHKSLTFNDFYQAHTGLEHLSGVEKGGTFVLVTDDSNQVIADFALAGKVVSKDCVFKPESIHLPPVAGTDVVYIVTSVFTMTDDGFYILQAQANINVLKNDYSMNSPLSACENTANGGLNVFLRQNESERKGTLSLDSHENGVIHYKIEMKIADAIVADIPSRPIDMVTYDLFDYELQETNALGEVKSDRGKVIIVIIPQPVFDTTTTSTTKGAIVRGRVTDPFSQQGITKVAVTVREDTTNGTWTNGEGYYQLPKSIESGQVVTLEFRSDRHYGKEHLIAIPVAVDNFDASVTLDQRINFRGRVIAANGIVGKNVSVSIANMNIPPVTTDENGFYEIQLPTAEIPDKVMIVATHPELGNAILKEPINLKDNTMDLKNVNLQLEKGLIAMKSNWNLGLKNTFLDRTIFKKWNN